MRILHGPVNIANQAVLLAEAMRRNGHDAEVWTFGTSSFGYPSERLLSVPSTAREAVRLVDEVLAGGFDVIHLHYARSFLPRNLNLPIMWDVDAFIASGARVVHSFHGTDIRRADLDKSLNEWSYLNYGAPSRPAEEIALDQAYIRPRAHATTTSSASMAIHSPGAQYLPLAIDVANLTPSPAPERFVVAHAPSLRATKGTDLILATLAKLQELRPDIDVDLIESSPNAEVLARFARASVIIEKVLGDGYGMTCLEAMALERPVITRATERSTGLSPGWPALSCDPPGLLDLLLKLADDPEWRLELGQRGRRFVTEFHSLEAAATRLEQLYDPEQSRNTIADTFDDEFADTRTALEAARAQAVVLTNELASTKTALVESRSRVKALYTERGGPVSRRLRKWAKGDGPAGAPLRAAARGVRKLRPPRGQ